MTAVPHFIKLPHVELIGPGDIVLAATSTNLNLTHTIDTVLASYAGQQYVCKTVLEIDSVDIHLQSFSDAYTINVQSKCLVMSHVYLFILHPHINKYFLDIAESNYVYTRYNTLSCTLTSCSLQATYFCNNDYYCVARIISFNV